MDIPVEGTADMEATESTSPVVINGQFPVMKGMQVVGVDGGHIGQLKEVTVTSVLVDRPWQRDVHVPFDAIREVAQGRLVLTIPADQIDAMDWPKPSLL